MAESSQNWNVEIIPGARRVKRVVGMVVDFATFPRADGYPSDHRRTGAAAMLDAAMDEPAQLPFPGEIGGVLAQPSFDFDGPEAA
jgi:hypothetical protein